MTAALGDRERAELLRLGTATLYEAARRDCFLPHRLRPAWPGAALVGRALPVWAAPADNLALHAALDSAEPGDVLVVDGHQRACGYWGEILAVAALARGVVGLVIDGGVRDVARLAQLGFPAFSASIAVRTTVKQDAGRIGQPLELGGVTIERGDVIVADDDGVISLPAADLEQVLDAARARDRAEAGYLERIGAGESTLDIYQLRRLLGPG
ncbi:4-carboxy-4-hydroxy-2-oxoadipate aldolase/oxaloacetate decarboxylase [Micromonospora sp. NBC_01699]|uniref:4-carboxy-4-hydroxy-2-oxoadipate aldolase/oxaloacetate decarboxylase n=1 Tax=Micromonospora sp. NBC_01699 TaxID=2975984 RepID=UPI002E2F1712|nr:4-carboxy-4-hydroxy-2-oxoadipate aldolase/oxaloacetate decarboxylase [Micromonospora sp. NBC_01699]